jgi:hypothetical protein
MTMRQLISIHGQDSAPYCWKCTQCDQLFWTSNDPAHRTPPARVWAHFQQHSCEAFMVISRWLAGAIKSEPCDGTASLSGKHVASHLLGRAGKLARWFSKSIAPPSGIPAGYSVIGSDASKDEETSKAKAATAGPS